MPITPGNPYFAIARMHHGNVQLTNGAIDVPLADITANAHVFFSQFQTNHSNLGTIHLHSITPGVGFTLHSTNVSDDSIVTWYCIEYYAASS